MAQHPFDKHIINFKGYQGNPLIKGAGVEQRWTDEMQEEFYKCSQDPIYFIKKYIKVIHVDRGLIDLDLYDYQEEIIDKAVHNRNVIVCTSRQAGKTTSIVGFAVWYIIFNSHKDVGILANKASTAREILNRVQRAYSHLPKWIQIGVIEWNKGSVTLENGSRILAEATSSDAVRGWSFACIIIDEAAHIENWDEFSTSVLPTISSGQTTKMIMISTPNGLNHFHKTWVESLEGRNEYKRIFVKWNAVPGRDEAWRKKTLADLNHDQDKFNQEYECEFLGSSGSLISGSKLKELVHRTPIHSHDGLYQYEDADKKHSYVIVADNSEGKGLDYSAFVVIDVTSMPYNQVCIFRSNMITPTDYAEVIYRVAKIYNTAQVLIELNALGEQIATVLMESLEYEHVLQTMNAGRNGKKITMSAGKGIDKGIKTSSSVKSTGCSMLKLLVEQNQLIINDFYTINELSTFSRKGSSYQAEPGKHDDLAMCLVLFAWLSDQQYFKELTDINTLNRLRDISQEDFDNSLAIFGYITSGIEDIDPREETAYRLRQGEAEAYIDEIGYTLSDDWRDLLKSF